MNINITLLDDEIDCETCGGSYAEGAIVEFGDGSKLEFVPKAHCFSSVSYEREVIFSKILERLGHEVVVNYGM